MSTPGLRAARRSSAADAPSRRERRGRCSRRSGRAASRRPRAPPQPAPPLPRRGLRRSVRSIPVPGRSPHGGVRTGGRDGCDAPDVVDLVGPVAPPPARRRQVQHGGLAGAQQLPYEAPVRLLAARASGCRWAPARFGRHLAAPTGPWRRSGRGGRRSHRRTGRSRRAASRTPRAAREEVVAFVGGRELGRDHHRAPRRRRKALHVDRVARDHGVLGKRREVARPSSARAGRTARRSDRGPRAARRGAPGRSAPRRAPARRVPALV